MIPSKLLDRMHQSRYLYIDKNHREIYAWYGANIIHVYNYIGEEICMCNIIKYNEDREYKQYEQINLRDVTVSIDDIIRSHYVNEKEKEIKQR